jgi:23S rRNA (guanosine2251-2'-O)-methyltransferase
MTKIPTQVILHDIRSALNVGAIFRTCDATGTEKLHLSGITPYPPHNKIPKTALGATERVEWEHTRDIDEILNSLKTNNIKIVSVEITAKSISYFEFDFTVPNALIFGNEISGIDVDIINKSDAIVQVPMFGYKKSLNVATTCGIVLYEAVRQILYKQTT